MAGMGLRLRGQRDRAAALTALATATAITATIALMLERRHAEWLHPIGDSISILHIAALMAAAAVAWAMKLGYTPHPLGRFLRASVFTSIAPGLLYLLYPMLFDGVLGP